MEQINLRDFPVIKLPLKKNQLTADRFASRTRDGTKPVSESVFHPYGVWDLEIDFFFTFAYFILLFSFFFLELGIKYRVSSMLGTTVAPALEFIIIPLQLKVLILSSPCLRATKNTIDM